MIRPIRRIVLVSLASAILALLFGWQSATATAGWMWTPEIGRWIRLKGQPRDTAEEQFDSAVSLYQEKRYENALEEFHKVVEYFPSSALAPEAQYHIGVCQEAMGNFYEAFEAYQVLIETYPQTKRLSEVIAREYQIGNLFQGGYKRKLWKFHILPSREKAIEIYAKIVENAPFGEYAQRAQFRLGQTYQSERRFNEAIGEFRKLIQLYPDSELVDDAAYQVALCYESISQEASTETEFIEDTIAQFDNFIATYPNSNKVAEAKSHIDQLRTRQAQKLFETGEFYEKQEYFKSAQIYYREILAEYPGTEWAAKAMARMTEIETRQKGTKP